MSERILLIDTCSLKGRVALASGEAVVAEAVMTGRTYSERLVSEGMRLLAEAGWRLQDLAAIAVVRGPGSFTGVRVGVSAAKGWSEAGGVPVIALSRLELLAAQTAGDAIAVLDAGRGEYYLRHGEEERLVDRAELLALAHGGEIVVCEPGVADALADLFPIIVKEPGAEAVLRLARVRLAAGESADVATLDANYVRRSDAEIFAKPAGAKTPPAGENTENAR
jgi:tRNA threonylcarbamoyladenosine biosynthesis protein TsaB